MKISIMIKIKSIYIIFLFFNFSFSYSQNGNEIIKKMINSINHIDAMEFNLKQKERICGKLVEINSFTKILYNPLKIYYKQFYPDNGMEVLYVTGWNDNKAKVNPNSFPWINLDLDINGETMRKNQHHTLNECGLKYLANVLNKLLIKYQTEVHSYIKLIDSEDYNGFNCFRISIENPNFKNIACVVKNGETITSIACKYNINDYMIIDKNKNIKNYNDISENDVIIIPVDYAKKIIVLIDKYKFLPYFIQIYDDNGLYEQYEFSDIVVNPVFSDDEFSMDFKDYKFY
jgi:hypothetical protein